MKKQWNTSNGDIIKFLSVYLFSALLLFFMRLFLYEYIAPFTLTIAVLVMAAGFTFCFGKNAWISLYGGESIKLSKRRAAVFSSLIFASGILIAVPLIYFGDYVSDISGMFYSKEGLFGENFVFSLIFTVIIPAVFIELVLRRTICNIIAKRFDGIVYYIVSSLFFALFFLDVTFFLPMFVMCTVFTFIEKIMKNTVFTVSCSVVWGFILYFFNFMFSLDGDGVRNLGIVGIFGMLFMFSSVAAAVLYIVSRCINKRKASYIEIATISIFIVLAFIIGCVMTSI